MIRTNTATSSLAVFRHEERGKQSSFANGVETMERNKLQRQPTVTFSGAQSSSFSSARLTVSTEEIDPPKEITSRKSSRRIKRNSITSMTPVKQQRPQLQLTRPLSFNRASKIESQRPEKTRKTSFYDKHSLNYQRNSFPASRGSSSFSRNSLPSQGGSGMPPKLMSCFQTPPPRTLFGTKNSEPWTSFHNRYSDSERNRRKTDGSAGEERKTGVLWAVVSRILMWDCIRPSTVYDNDDEHYEWNEDRLTPFEEYSWLNQTEERRRLQLVS